MRNYKRIYMTIELPEDMELEELKEAIEDGLVVVIKETDLEDGPNWHIAEL